MARCIRLWNNPGRANGTHMTESHMTESANPTESLHGLSGRTTPTWEMELLVSGATVFGLLQLPGPLTAWTQGWINGNERELANFALVFGMYLQFSLVTLIATFVFHLLLRGYWVALVGLFSVYPTGIRWDNNKGFGPIYRLSSEKSTPPASALIEAADNRATRVFGIGFGVAMALIVPTALVGGFLLVLVVVQAMNIDAAPWQLGFWIVFAVLFLPFLGAYGYDRWRGQQLIDQGRASSLMRVFDFYTRIGMGRASNPLLALFASQVGQGRSTVYLIAGMMPVMIVISLVIATRGQSLDNGAFDGLPGYEPAATQTLFNSHYASLRNGNDDVRLPFIADPLVKDATLRLFIPYFPLRHTPLMRRQCPQVLTPKAIERGESLQCLARLHQLQIDGKPVTAAMLGGADPASGQRGAWAMIDLSTLADGQHELVVQRPVRLDSDGKPGETPPVWRIPFWKQRAGD